MDIGLSRETTEGTYTTSVRTLSARLFDPRH